MNAPDRIVRVFISSTFKDMHAERDHLVTVVFPELHERCERLGLEFFDVDLRWGVPVKGVDGETANSWEYCRKWINEAKPFFVCLLGQRYGWVPEPHQLKDEPDQQAQTSERRSITDMEVRHALEHDAHSRRCYFYLRKAQAPADAADFVDPPPWLDKLDQLKRRVRSCGRQVWEYSCEWKHNAFTGMEEFGQRVLDDLWSGILRDPRYVSKEVWEKVLGSDPNDDNRYTDESKPVPDDIAEKLILLAKPPPKSPLEAEHEQMAAFAKTRLRWFQGRAKELDELTTFIHDPAEDNKPRLAVIVAVPGQGKSALMAKFAQEIQHPASSIEHPLFLISHFVGATEQSSSAYALVKRLLDELDRSGIAWTAPPQDEGKPKEEPKLDFNSLCLRLAERLGDYAGERRIVFLLDALNQLNDGHELGWLPYRVGPSVRVVVSCIEDATSKEDSPEGKVLAALDARHLKPMRVPLGGLDEQDVRTIVIEYLREYCKELDTPHVDAICDGTKLPQARNPLYLLVMLAELRTLGGNEMNQKVPGLIADMAQHHPDTVSLFQWVLERMKRAEGFGAEAVRGWCLYLALGRAGMATRELADLLARKLGPETAAVALRIERGLRRYLQRRGETLDFFHGQLRLAVMESYGQEAKDILQGHRDIADYFLTLADPCRNKSWSGASLRPFQEIAVHLTGAQEWDDLCAYLTDFACLDRRIRAAQIIAVVTDQRATVAALPELAEEARRERERAEECAQYGAALIAYARDCGAGKDATLPVPPSTERSAAARELPEERSPRAKRLRIFANFIANQASLLSAWPEDFLPLAVNHTEDGPLTEAAGLLTTRSQPWIARSPRPPAPSPRPQCLLSLHGHTEPVTSVSMTPDGRLAVSASEDRTLRVWDLETGQCLHTLEGHTSSVTSVSVTPDGRHAVSGSMDTTLRLWNLDSGQCLRTLQGHTDKVTSVSVTPDGRRAVSASGDRTLRVWDLNSGECLHTLQGHTRDVTCVSVTPDGRHAVSGGGFRDETLRVWDLETGQCLRTLQGHTGRITNVSITPDCRRAVSVANDCTPRLWNLDSGECLATLQGHLSSVTSVSATPDGRRAVSSAIGAISTGVGDFTLRLWDLDSGQCLRTLKGHTLKVNSVSISPDGRHAVSASDDRTLRVWDLDSVECLQSAQRHTDGVGHVSITDDDKRALSVSRNEILVWDLDTGQCLHTLQQNFIRQVSVTPDRRRAVSANEHETLRVWDLDSGQCLRTLQGHTSWVTSVSVTPDGRHAVSGSFDNTLRVWDLDSGQCLHTLRGHADGVFRVSVTTDGRRAVSASGDRTLRVWDLYSGQCLRTLQGHSSEVTSVSVTPDGRHAVSCGDNTFRVWDLDSGQCLHVLHGYGTVNSVNLTPNGQTVISAGKDDTLCVWDLHSGKRLATYFAGVAVRCVSAFYAGTRIVCGTSDGQMHFLTLRNFEQI